MDRKKEIIMNQEMLQNAVSIIESDNVKEYKSVLLDALHIVYDFLEKIKGE